MAELLPLKTYIITLKLSETTVNLFFFQGPGIFTSPKGVIQFGGSIGLSYVIWTWSGLISMLGTVNHL